MRPTGDAGGRARRRILAQHNGAMGVGVMHTERAVGEVQPVRSGTVRLARVAYLILTWVLVGCVAYQVFLAGLAVFVSPLNWGRHVFFVHFFELIPWVLLVLGFVGRIPKGGGFYAGPIAISFLIGLQYFFAGAGATALAALHTVNALLIFWTAVSLAQKAGRLGRRDAEV